MTVVTIPPDTTRVRHRLALLIAVAAAAVIMGLPTLRGGFVGGDDHRLLLNHVLVNHPSMDHALQLFTISHRDLYQPLPLLSFSAEFVVADFFGLFDRGVEAGAWLFHLTNILLHALNTVLVWLLICKCHQRAAPRRQALIGKDRSSAGYGEHAPAQFVATAAAVLFAIHPLQVEVIAWTNGRMMLMSTLFALASMIAMADWLDNRKARTAILTVAFVLLCAISKVRVGLPILLLIVVWARQVKMSRGVITLWLVGTAVMGVFAVINIQATADAQLFSQGTEHLTGSRVVRILMALAWYFQHLVWPSGLASYYPTPPHAEWSHAATWNVVGLLIAASVLLAWAAWRSRVARLGILWFFATIASTLPLVPARNILAADRYMYLPIIGLFWGIAAFASWAYQRLSADRSFAWMKTSLTVLLIALVPLMIGTGWHVASFYESSIKKTGRIANLFPDTPRVWEKLGWCHYSQGDYARAKEYAQKELRHDAPTVRSGATQLIAMTELRLGNGDRALRLLREAIETDPKSALAKYRLGVAYEELGRADDAIQFFQQAVVAAPSHNPTINRLAKVYRLVGRVGEARVMYAKAINNNKYEVPATMGLAELDILEGTRDSLLAATGRLSELLDWMPENAEARGLYAWSLSQLGDVRSADAQCDQRVNGARSTPMILATRTYIALVRERYASAVASAESLCAIGDQADGARAQLLSALERFDNDHPEIPWTFCIAARLLMAGGNATGAEVSVEFCQARCHDLQCRMHIQELKARLRSEKGFVGAKKRDARP